MQERCAKLRILFVDDEEKVLSGLRRLLRTKRREWEMSFVDSAAKALDELANRAFNVVVSDVRMMDMDGIRFLTEVSARFPRVIRIVLSGQADRELILRGIAPIHQYLSKPCDPDILISTLERAVGLHGLLDDSELQSLVSRLELLPSIPQLYQTLVEVIDEPDTTINDIGDIIVQDPGMTVKVLQLVNSAFFGTRRTVTDPKEAVGFLGLDTIKSLVLTVKLFEQFDGNIFSELSIDKIWNHSLHVGVMAREIARSLHLSDDTVKDCFTAGLLHDVGKLLLAQNFNDAYHNVNYIMLEEELQNWEAELKIFGASHAKVGAYLIGLWGLPESIVEALAFHHQPRELKHDKIIPLTAVHVANTLVHGTESPIPDGSHEPDSKYLLELGLADKLSHWRDEATEFSI